MMTNTSYTNTGIVSKVETLTPYICEQLLIKNSHNRDLRQYIIEKYAKAMESGEWRLNGEPVIIADNGDIMDGQHRMYGCIRANAPFTSMVTRGVPRETFPTIDTGVGRNGADVLRINGLSSSNSNICGASAALCIMLEQTGLIHGGARYSYLITPARRAAWVDNNPRIIEIANSLTEYSWTGSFISKSQAAFLWFYMETKRRNCTDEFFNKFLTGAGLQPLDPVLVLRQRIDAQRVSSKKWTKHTKLGAIIRTWDWHCRGLQAKHPQNMLKDFDRAFGLIATSSQGES